MKKPTLEECCIQIKIAEDEVQSRISQHDNFIADNLKLEYRDFIELKNQFYEKPETDETVNYLIDTIEDIFRVLKRNGIDVKKYA